MIEHIYLKAEQLQRKALETKYGNTEVCLYLIVEVLELVRDLADEAQPQNTLGHEE